MRRTQQERRSATRAALLGAAIDCLVEYGYDGTTTGRVCERAGVSRGAHLHHFGTRSTLVAAGLVELARRRDERFDEDLARIGAGDRVEQGLELLWAWFTGPLFRASVDVAAAARTDPELRAGLAPAERWLSQRTLRRCRELFAAGADDASYDQPIQMALGTIRGLALLPVLQPGYRGLAKQWDFARQQLARTIRDHDAAS